MVPQFISKSKLVWDHEMWSDYKCIYISSKTPTSNTMVGRELQRLQNIVESFPNATVVGHSLGGWWAANLALQSNVDIPKLVLWTPLNDIDLYPVFNVTNKYIPTKRKLTTNNIYSHRVLTFIAKEDLIVPPAVHGKALAQHFRSMEYILDGGHFYQKNHKVALSYMKDWIEVK